MTMKIAKHISRRLKLTFNERKKVLGQTFFLKKGITQNLKSWRTICSPSLKSSAPKFYIINISESAARMCSTA